MDWNVDIETTTRMEDASDSFLDTILDALALYHATISATPRGWASITLTLPAASAEQAITTATALVRGATEVAITGVAALPTAIWDERVMDNDSEMMSVTEVATLIKRTRGRIYQLIDEGSLPIRRAGRTVLIPRGAAEELARHLNETAAA